MAESVPPFGFDDFRRILVARQSSSRTRLLLVGGQAVAFWDQHYRVSTVPVTSKDIDFFGDGRTAEELAKRLGGKHTLASFDDNTVNAAVVRFTDLDGNERDIDILSSVLGVDTPTLLKTALPFDVLDDQGQPTGEVLEVLHPALCLVSRITNIAQLPGRNRASDIRQLQSAIGSTRAFTSDLAKSDGRAALQLVKRVFKLCRQPVTTKVFDVTGVEPFDAVVGELTAYPMYATRVYPRWRAQIDTKRAR